MVNLPPVPPLGLTSHVRSTGPRGRRVGQSHETPQETTTPLRVLGRIDTKYRLDEARPFRSSGDLLDGQDPVSLTPRTRTEVGMWSVVTGSASRCSVVLPGW